MHDRQCDVAIIGAGIVGLAVGLEINRSFPALKILVLDKEREVAAHQTGHNSGVIHSGIYYKPGSIKARLSVEGAAAMARFCREHGLPLEVCGKLIVATREKEIPALEELLRRGRANGVPGVRALNGDEIREIEPHAAGFRGIHVPGGAVTDYKIVAQKFAELIGQGGGEVLTGAGVSAIVRKPDEVTLETAAGVVRARYVINCAGLQSDRIAKMAGADLGLQIVPFRGEFYEVAPEKRQVVRGLIYPVPDPRFPFLGVHLIKRTHGEIEVGPNAVLAFRREGYSRASFSCGDVAAMAFSSGFWIMASKYWRMGCEEFYRSWSKRSFTKAMQKLVPSLTGDDIHHAGSGVRAQALDRSGKLVDDFRFAFQSRMLHVCNVPSPAATACLTIAGEILSTLKKSNPLFADKRDMGQPRLHGTKLSET
jgi:(S)-2-hydroxyglutarate dehydrogenase